MDWKGAKTLIILLLVGLNVALFALAHVQRQRFVMDADRVSALTVVLQNQGILLESDIIRHYYPMRQMRLSTRGFEHFRDGNRFFDVTQASIENRVGATVLSLGTQRLTVSGNRMVYEKFSVRAAQEPLPQQEAITISERFLREVDIFDNFRLDRIEADNVFVFVEVFRGHVVSANYARISVGAGEVMRAEFRRFAPVDFVGQQQRISPADEAMLTFMHAVVGYERPIIVRQMDIVYDFDETKIGTGEFVNAVPCYRIFIDGDLKPYMINAFVNEMMGGSHGR